MNYRTISTAELTKAVARHGLNPDHAPWNEVQVMEMYRLLHDRIGIKETRRRVNEDQRFLRSNNLK